LPLEGMKIGTIGQIVRHLVHSFNFISRLILACPPELWEEVRAQMDAKYDDW
jgi:hypothetical protein